MATPAVTAPSFGFGQAPPVPQDGFRTTPRRFGQPESGSNFPQLSQYSNDEPVISAQTAAPEEGSHLINLEVQHECVRPDLGSFSGFLSMTTKEMEDHTFPSVDLVCLLDISGSMSGENIQLLKATLHAIVDDLRPGDRLGLLAFNSSVYCVSQLQCMTDSNKTQIRPLIDSLGANGGTDIKKALDHSLLMLQQRRTENSVAAVALLSDGQDNNRTSPDTATLRTLATLASVSAIGIGSSHDAQYLGEISLRGRGTFAYAQTADQIAGAMGAVVGNMLRVVAADVTLRIDTVGPTHLPATVEDVGLVFAGETKRYLFSASLSAAAAAYSAPFLQATLTYRLPGSPTLLTQRLEATYAPDYRPTAATLTLLEETRNRTKVAAAISTARALASDDKFVEARSCLEESKRQLLASLYPTSEHSRALLFDLESSLQSCRNTRSYSQGGSAQMQSAFSTHYTQKGSGCNDQSDNLYLSSAARTSKAVMASKASRSKTHS